MLLISFLSSLALAVPQELVSQGRLLDSTGVAVTGPHVMNIKLYDSDVGGNLLWEDIQSIDFVNGYYSISLGTNLGGNSLTSSILGEPNVYIEIAIDNAGPLLPRKPLKSTPYARIAGIAESVDGGSVNASEIQIGGSLVIDSAGQWVGTQASTNWSSIVGTPADILDGDDDSLAGISCAVGQILSWNGNAWGCADDNGLTEAEVENFITNAPIDLAQGTTMGGLNLLTTADQGVALSDLNCVNGEVAQFDAVAGWSCAMPMDTLSQVNCQDGEVVTYSASSNTWICSSFSAIIDQDSDGILSWLDCNDNDSSVGSNVGDADCDGVSTNTDCNDTDPLIGSNLNDSDCDGFDTLSDCDDNNPNMPALDADCDQSTSANDCDDNNPNLGDQSNDNDCDGVLTADDCDDNDPNVGSCTPPDSSTSSLALDGPVAMHGYYWYLGDGGVTCDNLCADFNGTNLSNDLINAWPDDCSGSNSGNGNDVSQYFYLNGNAANWNSLSATGYYTLGYGYIGSQMYHKCVSGTSMGHGTFPGDPNNDSTRTLVCPCFQQ